MMEPVRNPPKAPMSGFSISATTRTLSRKGSASPVVRASLRTAERSSVNVVSVGTGGGERASTQAEMPRAARTVATAMRTLDRIGALRITA
jgi:hypothetical protein